VTIKISKIQAPAKTVSILEQVIDDKKLVEEYGLSAKNSNVIEHYMATNTSK